MIKVINKVKNIGTQANGDLRMAEREDLYKFNNFKNKLDVIITELKKQWDSMSAKKMPTRPQYSIYEFDTEKINKLIQKELSDIV